MKSVKLAVIAALSSFAVSAFALSPMQDSDLSAVSGQDGVTIGANLNIDVGSFVYTDTDAAGGSIAFKGIEIRGAIAVEIDIINNATAKGTLAAVGVGGSDAATTAFLPAGDVVRIALPDVAVGTAVAGLSKATAVAGAARTSNNLYFGVARMEMGNSTKSFGAIAMNDIKMQGTTALIWAH
jgi:hypothetical protein